MSDLTLTFDFCERDDLVYQLISAFILHVLYARGILPEPFEGLHQTMLVEEAEIPTEKLKYADRKKRKSIYDIVNTLSAVRSISNYCGIETVAVLLGPSANNPKETYTMRLRPRASESDSTAISIKQVNQAKRHLIHKLIEHQSTEDCPPSTKANVFLALKLVEGYSYETLSAQLDQPLLLFSFRDSFKIKNGVAVVQQGGGAKKAFGGRRKAKPFHLCVTSKSEAIPNLTSAPDSDVGGVEGVDIAVDNTESQVSASGGIWLVLSRGIKNIPA